MQAEYLSIIAALSLCMAVNIPVYAQSGTYHYACVTESTCIYQGKDEESERIASLSEGDVCRVLSDGNGFSKVFSGGFTGYVDSGLLDSDEELMGSIVSHDGVAADRNTYIYAMPDEDAEIIASRRKGATESLSADGGNVEGWTRVVILMDAEGTQREGWMNNSDITPARIVNDAEPYMEPVDDGIIIADSDEYLVEDAKARRETAKALISSARPEQRKASNANTVPVRKGILNPHIGTVIGPTGCKETYYNLKMDGVVSIMRSKGYSEEEYPYWVRDDGAKMLGQYIMCAADLNLHPRGSLVESSLGTCIVADTGDFIYANPTQIDIAVTW